MDEKKGQPKSAKQLSWPVAYVVVERITEVNTQKNLKAFQLLIIAVKKISSNVLDPDGHLLSVR